MKKVNIKYKSSLNNELALFRANISIRDKIRILNNKKLKKNIRYILEEPEAKILAVRAVLGLATPAALIKHLTMYDGIGRSIGCGCELCQLKHKEYKLKQHNYKKRKFLQTLTHHHISSLANINRPFKEEQKIKELRFKVCSEIKDVFKQEFNLKVGRDRIKEVVIFSEDF